VAKEILLNAFDMNTIGHQSSGLWRHPRDRSQDYCSLDYWLELARTLERGLFDGIFLADVAGVYDVYAGTPDAALRAAAQIPTNDPFTLVPAMATVTEHLAFGVTGTLTYEPPYAFARRISSLDHLTKGRMGWNIVTGYLDSAARGMGQRQQASHGRRYAIADEYMEVVYKLWEGSWQDNAVLADAESGVYADPKRVHRVDHSGEHYQLDAVHLSAPSPQRTPVLFQAGSSASGQAFAARHAECVFTFAGPGLRERVVALRKQAIEAGREADALRIFTLVAVIVAPTDAQAQELLEEYTAYGLAEGALALMSGWSGIDLSSASLDESVAEVHTEAIQAAMRGAGSRTVREWAEFLAVGGAAPVVVGSPSTVADRLVELVDATGVDGFNLTYTVMPECVESIVDRLVPALQDRGRYKTEYSPGTYREKLYGRGPYLSDNHPVAAYRIAD